MKCKISGIEKNFRYCMITIEDEKYILDKGNSFWKSLFPPFSWIFTHTVYKVNNEETLEKLEPPNPRELPKQKSTGKLSLWGGAIGVSLGSLIYPYLNTSLFLDNLYINIMAMAIPYLFIVFSYVYIYWRFKKSLQQIIELQNFPTEKICIRPQSMKHMFTITFYFSLFLIVSILMFFSYIKNPNTLPLILGVGAFFFAAVGSFVSITPGDFIAKFKHIEKE